MNRARKLQLRLDRIRAKRSRSKDVIIDFPDLKKNNANEPVLSNTIDGTCVNKDKLNAHKWRRDAAKEKPETVREIKRKSNRIRPHFGKGNYQYATDGDNSGPISIYKKGA